MVNDSVTVKHVNMDMTRASNIELTYQKFKDAYDARKVELDKEIDDYKIVGASVDGSGNDDAHIVKEAKERVYRPLWESASNEVAEKIKVQLKDDYGDDALANIISDAFKAAMYDNIPVDDRAPVITNATKGRYVDRAIESLMRHSQTPPEQTPAAEQPQEEVPEFDKLFEEEGEAPVPAAQEQPVAGRNTIRINKQVYDNKMNPLIWQLLHTYLKKPQEGEDLLFEFKDEKERDEIDNKLAELGLKYESTADVRNRISQLEGVLEVKKKAGANLDDVKNASEAISGIKKDYDQGNVEKAKEKIDEIYDNFDTSFFLERVATPVVQAEQPKPQRVIKVAKGEASAEEIAVSKTLVKGFWAKRADRNKAEIEAELKTFQDPTLALFESYFGNGAGKQEVVDSILKDVKMKKIIDMKMEGKKVSMLFEDNEGKHYRSDKIVVKPKKGIAKAAWFGGGIYEIEEGVKYDHGPGLMAAPFPEMVRTPVQPPVSTEDGKEDDEADRPPAPAPVKRRTFGRFDSQLLKTYYGIPNGGRLSDQFRDSNLNGFFQEIGGHEAYFPTDNRTYAFLRAQFPEAELGADAALSVKLPQVPPPEMPHNASMANRNAPPTCVLPLEKPPIKVALSPDALQKLADAARKYSPSVQTDGNLSPLDKMDAELDEILRRK